MRIRRSRHSLCALTLICTLITACLLGGYGASSSAGAHTPATTTATPAIAATPTTTAIGVTRWQVVAEAPDQVSDFAFAPSNPAEGFLCSGDPTVQTTSQRLYASTNGGKSWTPVASAPNPGLGCNVFVDPSDAADVFLQSLAVGSNSEPIPVAQSFWRSRDGGASWHRLGLEAGTFGWRRLAVVGTRLLALAILPYGMAQGCDSSTPPGKPASLIYASDDGGQTWQKVGQSIMAQQLSMDSMSVMGMTIFALANTLYKGGCDQSPLISSLWRSSDGGRNWTRLSTPSGTIFGAVFTQAANGTYYSLAAGMNMDHTVDGEFTVLFSADGGTTWIKLPPFLDASGKPLAGGTGGIGSYIVTMQSAILLDVVQQAPDGSKGSPIDHIYRLAPGAATSSAWTLYADGDRAAWVVHPGSDSGLLWGLQMTGGMAGTFELLPLTA